MMRTISDEISEKMSCTIISTILVIIPIPIEVNNRLDAMSL